MYLFFLEAGRRNKDREVGISLKKRECPLWRKTSSLPRVCVLVSNKPIIIYLFIMSPKGVVSLL